MEFLLTFITSFIFTLFLTPYLIDYLTKMDVVDLPNERKIHTKAIPRMGGLIIYCFAILTFMIYLSSFNGLKPLILGSAVIVMCGVLDDVRGLKWYVKFILQGIAAINLLMYFHFNFANISLFGLTISSPFSYIIIVLFVMGTINAMNLMDGMDGLASGFSILIFMILAPLALMENNMVAGMVILAFIGSLLGFLKYNANPARIFLGDTGSLTLGYFLTFASMSISTHFSHNNVFNLTFPVILLGMPLLDTLKVMFMRIAGSTNPFLPDKNHLHHILLQSDFRHKISVFIILSIALLFGFVSLYYLKYSKVWGVYFFLILCAGVIAFQYILLRYDVFVVRDRLRSLIVGPLSLIRRGSRFFVHFAAVGALVFVVFNFPVTAQVDKNLIAVVLFGVISLFAVAIINKAKTHIMNDIYILFNLSVFFLFSHLSITINTYIKNELLSTIGLCGLIAAIIVFLLARERIFPQKKMFLSGLDLMMILIISSSFILNKIFLGKLYYDVSISLLSAFVLYMLYKIIIYYNVKYLGPLFYSSFALSLAAVLILLIS